MAGSSVTITKERKFKGSFTVDEYTFAFTADDADGTVPAASTVGEVNGYVTQMITNPGSTAPTADYDITITDDQGVDILGGEGADRSATASEQVMPKLGNGYGPRRVDSVLTLNITNNAVNSATGVVILSVMV